MRFGLELRLPIRGVCGLGTAGASKELGTWCVTLSRGCPSGPPIHNRGPCSRPEEDPNAWKQFGPKPDPRSIEPR